jgi:hypothetical protein
MDMAYVHFMTWANYVLILLSNRTEFIMLYRCSLESSKTLVARFIGNIVLPEIPRIIVPSGNTLTRNRTQYY